MSLFIFQSIEYTRGMFQEKSVGAVLLMGGTGSRLGGSIPKQFLLLGEKPVFMYALETLVASGCFDEILLVCHADWVAVAREWAPLAQIVVGGASRQESSWLGIQGFEKQPDLILIHDAVRPFVSERIVRNNLQAASDLGAADTCIPSADTLVHAPEGGTIAAIPRRADYLRGQTPQTFRSDWLHQAHLAACATGLSESTDDCKLVLELGHPIAVVPGEEANFKITTSFDFWLAEQFLLNT